jgi:hypothetical protein
MGGRVDEEACVIDDVAAAAALESDPSVLEFEDDLEPEGLPDIQQDKRTIRTRSADPEIESLHGKWKRGKLVLQPGFQRQYVWDRKKASRLVESVLLSVPLPIIYLAEEPDLRESVIDGQQRLTSFFAFIDGRFEASPFKLTGLDVYKELNGKTFADLSDELQDKIRYCEVRTVTILSDSDEELKFEIFERLNTGSVALNDMELRNCVYRGPYMEALRNLAADSEFTSVMGLKEPDRRMRDIELVLRFASFYHATYLKYQSPMRRFFNEDMEQYAAITPAQVAALKGAFRNALAIVRSVFGDSAFKRFYPGNEANPNGWWEQRKFNASLFDVWMGVFAEVDKNRAYAALDRLRESLIQLMSTNSQFMDTITRSTSAQEQVRVRFDLARQVVDQVLKDYPPQPRLFTRALKQSLFDADATCAICGHAIQTLDDSHVDHVKQYWTGGETIPENARLTHRYCNMSRPRSDVTA